MVDAPYQNPYVDPYPGASQNSIDMRRRYALGVLQQAGDGTPTKANAIGAIARALQGAMGGYLAGQADQSDLADKAKTQALVQQLIGGSATGSATPPAIPPAPQAGATPAGSAQPETPFSARFGNWQQGPNGTTSAAPPQSPYASAISGIESGGKYDTLGPVTRTGDRAYGKYQVMGTNVPQWTQEVLGKPMSPQQFLNDPQAQDAVFNAKFGQYAQKYGPEGAARAWFAGEGGMNDLNRRDQLGTSVSSYARQFNAGMGQQPYQVASLNPTAGPSQSPSGSVPSAPIQVAQNAPQAPQPPTPPVGNPDRAAIIAQLLATRSGGQIGSGIAGALINQQIAPAEFKQIGQDVLGRPQYGWVRPQNQSVTPVGSAGNAASSGASPGSDASFTQIQSAVAKGAAPADVYQYVPVELREAVKSIVEGRGVPTNLGTRGNARNAAMMYAHAVDPSFDEALIPQRMTFARSMGSMSPSAVGGQKVLLGTSLGHLADLSDSAVDMGNSNGLGLAPLAHGYNAVMNQGTDQSAKALALEDKAQKFSGEVGKLYSGSAGGGVHEREETRSRIGATKSPAELAAGLEANRDLILSKLQALEEQRDAAFGRNGPKVIEFQTPQVKATLDRIQRNIDKLRGKGAPDQTAAPSPSAPAPKPGAYRFNPATGQLEPQ